MFVSVYPFTFGVLRLFSVSALVFHCTCFRFDMIVMYNISFPDQTQAIQDKCQAGGIALSGPVAGGAQVAEGLVVAAPPHYVSGDEDDDDRLESEEVRCFTSSRSKSKMFQCCACTCISVRTHSNDSFVAE